MTPLRVALCGLGSAGQQHARALGALSPDDGVRWTAVAARDAAGLARFRAPGPVPAGLRAYGSLDALLAEDACDAVILATPDGLHVPQALQCIAAGRHVLVEKPLAFDAEGARAVVQAAAAASVVLSVGYHLRHHAGHRLMKARLAELCGPLHHVAASWAWPDPATAGWRARGIGARSWSVAALGTHCLDLLAWLTELAPLQVAAVRWPPTGIDHAAVVSMVLANGATAQVSCSVTHRAPTRLILAGARGELEARSTFGAHGGGELWYRPVAPRGQYMPLPFRSENPYQVQLRSFATQVASGSAPDGPSWIDHASLLERVLPAAAAAAASPCGAEHFVGNRGEGLSKGPG